MLVSDCQMCLNDFDGGCHGVKCCLIFAKRVLMIFDDAYHGVKSRIVIVTCVSLIFDDGYEGMCQN